MLRQPLQRFTQMQATDIDIYRKELQRSKINMVGHPHGCRAAQRCRRQELSSVPHTVTGTSIARSSGPAPSLLCAGGGQPWGD